MCPSQCMKRVDRNLPLSLLLSRLLWGQPAFKALPYRRRPLLLPFQYSGSIFLLQWFQHCCSAWVFPKIVCQFLYNWFFWLFELLLIHLLFSFSIRVCYFTEFYTIHSVFHLHFIYSLQCFHDWNFVLLVFLFLCAVCKTGMICSQIKSSVSLFLKASCLNFHLVKYNYVGWHLFSGI